MNLPNEVVELVIDHFLKSTEHTTLSYIIALNAVSLISSNYLERSRHIRFKSITLKYNLVKIKHHESTQFIEASHLLPRLRRSKLNPLTFNLAHYVKHLTLCQTKDLCRVFNKLIGNQLLVLESLKFRYYCNDPDACFSSLVLNRLSRIESFIIRSSNMTLNGLRSCVQTMQNKLDTLFKLSIDCSIQGDEFDIALPIHALKASLFKGSSISCFKPSFHTLKKLDLTIFKDCNCDVLISQVLRLQDLNIRRDEFDRESIIATLRIARTLSDIRKVSFTQNLSGHAQTITIDFFFEKQILVGIDAFLQESRKMDLELYMLIRKLVVDDSYVAKKDVIEEILGQTSDVDIRCFYKGTYMRRESLAYSFVLSFLCDIDF